MTSPIASPLASRLVLDETCAADLMSPNLSFIRAQAIVPEAIGLLTHRGVGAAAVIDEAGRPVGVVSRADILIHQRELALPDGTIPADSALVRDIMTPAIFSVATDTPIDKVVEQMLTLNVHYLFVVDDDQLPIGILSPFDILRRLRPI